MKLNKTQQKTGRSTKNWDIQESQETQGKVKHTEI